MNRNEISVNFADLSDQAEGFNRRNRTRRFYPMQQYRAGRLWQFGMYDGVSKKYVLSEINDREAAERIAEIRRMLSAAG